MALSKASSVGNEFPKPWSGNIQFDKENVLGKGGFAVVFRGIYNNDIIAVKRIVVENVDPLNREVTLQTQLDHENVLKILSVEQSDEFRYIVLELCVGTLEQLCNGTYVGDELPSDAKILLQIAKGLSYVHSKKMVHRDIKPENILFSNKTIPVLVKLSDFGLSKQLSTNDTCTTSGFKGSQLWMPAELLRLMDTSLQMTAAFEAKGSPSSDIFATGCVTFYYVTRGIHPFGSNAIEVPNNICHDNPVNIEKGDPGLNLLLDIAREMIKFNPKERLGLDKVLEKLQSRQRLSSTRTASFHMTSRLCRQEMPDNKVTTCVFHPIDAVLAVGFQDGNVTLLMDETDDQPFLHWKEEPMLAVHDHLQGPFALTKMEWNINGTLLAAITDKGSIILWTYRDKEIIFDSVQHVDSVGQIYWNPFVSDLLAVSLPQKTRRRTSHDGNSALKGGIFVWNAAAEEEEILKLKLRTTHYIRDVAWIADGEIALACHDGTIRFFLINNSTFPIQLHAGDVGAIAWNEHRKMLASGSSEGTVKIWKKDGMQISLRYELNANASCLSLSWYPCPRESSAADAANTHLIACGLNSGCITVWKPEIESIPTTFPAHDQMVHDVSFSPNGQFLATIGADDNLHVWSTKLWEEIGCLEMKKQSINSRKISWDSSSQRLTTPSELAKIIVVEPSILPLID